MMGLRLVTRTWVPAGDCFTAGSAAAPVTPRSRPPWPGPARAAAVQRPPVRQRGAAEGRTPRAGAGTLPLQVPRREHDVDIPLSPSPLPCFPQIRISEHLAGRPPPGQARARSDQLCGRPAGRLAGGRWWRCSLRASSPPGSEQAPGAAARPAGRAGPAGLLRKGRRPSGLRGGGSAGPGLGRAGALPARKGRETDALRAASPWAREGRPSDCAWPARSASG